MGKEANWACWQKKRVPLLTVLFTFLPRPAITSTLSNSLTGAGRVHRLNTSLDRSGRNGCARAGMNKQVLFKCELVAIRHVIVNSPVRSNEARACSKWTFQDGFTIQTKLGEPISNRHHACSRARAERGCAKYASYFQARLSS